MLRITDFSKLQPGFVHLGKEARSCPHCGKVGLFDSVGGADLYLHSRTVGFDDSGNFVNESEQCPKK
jgi:hypothetical protein